MWCARLNECTSFTSNWLPVHKSPDVLIESAELFLHLEESTSILNRGRNLQSIANNSCIVQQLRSFSLIVFRYLRRVEVIESAAIIVSLSQNRLPTQTCLRTFQDQKFKQRSIVVHGHTPFPIVISNCVFAFCPLTATRMAIYLAGIQIDLG